MLLVICEIVRSEGAWFGWMVRGNSSVVMPFALKNLEYVFFRCYCANAEDNPVFLVDAYTSPAAEIAAKRFWVADTSSSVAIDALKELINALERLDILQLSSKIFIPSVFMPDFTHD